MTQADLTRGRVDSQAELTSELSSENSGRSLSLAAQRQHATNLILCGITFRRKSQSKKINLCYVYIQLLLKSTLKLCSEKFTCEKSK